jgi:hypothetical protein
MRNFGLEMLNKFVQKELVTSILKLMANKVKLCNNTYSNGYILFAISILYF